MSLDISLGCQWCCQLHYCIYQVLEIKIRWNKIFSVMWCHRYQHYCHMMLTASSMALFCSIHVCSWNKVCHDPLGHVMLLQWELASCNTESFFHGTIMFVRSRWLKRYNMTFLVMWHYWHWPQLHMMPVVQLHSLGQDNQNDVQGAFLGHVMPLELGWHGHHMMWLASTFAPYDATDTGDMWCHWYHETQMALSMAPLHSLREDIKMRCNVTSSSSDTNSITKNHWHHQWHMTLMPEPVLSMPKVIKYL